MFWCIFIQKTFVDRIFATTLFIFDAKQTLKWLHLAVLVFIFAWLALLSVLTARNWKIAMPQDFEGFREVRKFSSEIWADESGHFWYFWTQVRDRRQLVSDQTSTLEGDIIVRRPNAGNLTSSWTPHLLTPTASGHGVWWSIAFMGPFQCRTGGKSFSQWSISLAKSHASRSTLKMSRP